MKLKLVEMFTAGQVFRNQLSYQHDTCGMLLTSSTAASASTETDVRVSRGLRVCLLLPVRTPAVRSVRLLARRQDGDLQERLRGVVAAGLRHQRGVSLSGPHQSGLQPSEERQGPVQGRLQGEEPGRPAELRVRPPGLQPGPVQPEPHERAQSQTLLYLPHTVGQRGQNRDLQGAPAALRF